MRSSLMRFMAKKNSTLQNRLASAVRRALPLPGGEAAIRPLIEPVEQRVLMSGSTISGALVLELAHGQRDTADYLPETLYLDANNNGKLDSGEMTTTSNTDGTFQFTNVPPGTYVVRQVLPAYKVQNDPVDNYGVHITVTSTPSSQGAVFYNSYLTGDISGTVYDDSNNNGKLDSGDTGINGLTLYLDENNNGRYDSGEPTTVTTSGGGYSFDDVLKGDYIVRAELPAGYSQITPANNYGHHVTVVGDPNDQDSISNENFLLKAPADTISGTISKDTFGSGYEYELGAGLAGWTVYIDLNDSGRFDAGDPTTTTNADGDFQFSSLPGGTFIVRVDAPAGWAETYPAGNTGHTVTLLSGGSATGVIFGFYQLPTTTDSISGVVYDDANGDGTQEGGEAGLSGWTVYLDANNNGVYDTGEAHTVSGTDGTYSFNDLSPGNYIVRVQSPTDWSQTYPTNNYGQHISLTSTSTFVNNANFGFEETTGTITGEVYVDNTSGNAVGWTVYLDLNNNGKLDPGEPTTTVTADQYDNYLYTFNNLVPGNYIVRVAAPAGWTQVSPGDNYGDHITVVPGQLTNFQNFSFTRTGPGAQIRGTVFDDANGNGIVDSGESGLAGWYVFIGPPDSNTLNGENYAVTDSSGNYYFEALAPGTYSITIEGNGYYQQTLPASGDQYEVTVTANQDATGYNFGERLIS